ncbi:MAG: hypothetical protein N3B10_03430 [Armatimonadetes bacterium]|nr:hypothetical protein [Armatimonadota bacterium]
MFVGVDKPNRNIGLGNSLWQLRFGREQKPIPTVAATEATWDGIREVFGFSHESAKS